MKHNKEFTITVPDSPTPKQIGALWQSGRNALARLVNLLIDRCLENGMLTICDGKIIPSDDAEVLQMASADDIIKASLVEEVL